MQYTVKSLSTGSLEEKKSNFLSFLVPYEEFDATMEKLKLEHTKARHFVYAYRYLNELKQTVENLSDDGEPKGSSGRPVLTVLQGRELINTGVIVVRYFGGTKLGVGGLVRAYSDAVNLAINDAEQNSLIIPYVETKSLKFAVSFSNFNKFLYLVNTLNASVTDKEFGAEGVTATLNFKVDDEQKIISSLTDNLLSTVIEEP